MLRFEHPDLLWFLAAVPLLAAGLFALYVHQRRLLAMFASLRLLKELSPDLSGAKRALKNGALLGGFAMLILAAANPQVGTRLEEVKREGIDLFVALDVSLSMKAEDIRPSRLEKAKRDVSSLLSKLKGDRVGLIVFAGDAFVQFPLTSDYSAADLFISAVDVDAVPTPGTMIASAIELALKSFSEDLPTEKAIIVVSDGENTEGDIEEAMTKATSAGVKVFTVGMGTPAGGPIPIYDGAGNRVDYKRDRNGAIVLTKLDETTLQRLAATTGGSYHRATSGGNEIDDVYEELLTLERVEFEAKQVTGYESVYQYPLGLAIVLFVLDLLLSERRGTVLRTLRRLIPAAVGALVVLSPSVHSQTHRSLISEGNEAYKRENYSEAETQYKKALQKYPDSDVGRFNAGNAYYKQQRYDEAGQAFRDYAAVSRDPVNTSKAYYNIGNSLFQSQKLDESIEAYKQALRLNPRDMDARFNLELARRKKQEQQQQNNQQQNRRQQDQKDQRQEQQNDRREDQQQKQDRQQQQNQQQQDQRTPQQEQQQLQKQTIPRQQAERILEALKNSEKEIQKQLRKREGMRIKTDKDW